MVEYIKESYDELVNKVTWPTWKDLQSSTILVLVGTLIFALVVYIMDVGMSNAMDIIYNLFK